MALILYYHPLASFCWKARYLGRLKARPSFARVLEEAKPYFKMFPEQNAAS